MNVGASVKNWMLGALPKMIIRGILVHIIASVVSHVKLLNIYILKIAHVKKRLIGKLVIEYKNEILITTDTALDDKKVTCKKIVVLFSEFQ